MDLLYVHVFPSNFMYLLVHYFRAICWNQGSGVRQQVETCFGVT